MPMFSVFIGSTYPYFNTDPVIEFAQSSTGIRYYNKNGGWYIRERDLDLLMPKSERSASLQRKRFCQEELAVHPSKSRGQERSISRSRDPSQNSRGNSSARMDLNAFVPAHQRDHRIGELRTLTEKHILSGYLSAHSDLRRRNTEYLQQLRMASLLTRWSIQ